MFIMFAVLNANAQNLTFNILDTSALNSNPSLSSNPSP